MEKLFTRWVVSLRSRTAAGGIVRSLNEIEVAWRESKALDYIHSVLDDFRGIDSIVGWSVNPRENDVPGSYLSLRIVARSPSSPAMRSQVMRSLREVNERFRTHITARIVEHTAPAEQTIRHDIAAPAGITMPADHG